MIVRWNTTAALLLTGALTVAAPPLRAQPPFEGAVTIRVSTKTPQGVMSQQVEYLMRAGKVRVNMGAPAGMPIAGASMIMVPQEKKLYMLMAAQNAYMEMAIPDTMAAAAARRAAGAAEEAKVVRTGKRETIAGLTCEHVTVTASSGSSDMCMSKELGRYVNPTDVMRQGAAPWQRELANEFPLKVTMPDGSIPLEVIKVERKRLSNDLFTVPGTYNKVTMPAGRPPTGRPPVR